MQRILRVVREGGVLKGLDALNKHAGGMFVAKERSNLRLRRGPEAVGEVDWGIVQLHCIVFA